MTITEGSQLQLGSPHIAGALAVFPILGGAAPRLEYRSLAQAVKRGAFISEVGAQGNVNELLVCNASDLPLLLYEGELVEGARQNRTIDAPALVPAGVELRIPVSCVEQGRWDYSRHVEPMAPVRSAVDPELRAEKRADANARSASGSAPRPAQAAVWGGVGRTLAHHETTSASMALTDVYHARRCELDRLTRDLPVLEEQVGAIVEIAGRPVALDLVSRAEVFADLVPRLADGYALKALRAPTGHPSEQAAEAYLQDVLSAPRRWLPTPGMGEAFAPSARDLQGCGLTVDGELVALSAFPAEGCPVARAA